MGLFHLFIRASIRNPRVSGFTWLSVSWIFPDLTTEGSFPSWWPAVTLMNFGWNPILANVSVVAWLPEVPDLGLVSLYTKGEIPTILAGILVHDLSTPVMLMIMGRANLGLLDIKTYSRFASLSARTTTSWIVGLIGGNHCYPRPWLPFS